MSHQKLTLAKIEIVNSVFGRSVDVVFFAPHGKADYKEYRQKGFIDVYSAEDFAFRQNVQLLRDRLVKWKDQLLYLSKYGYLHGDAKLRAEQAARLTNEYLYKISKVNVTRTDVVKAFDVIAYALRSAMPHPESDRYRQYCKLADLLAEFFTLYKEEVCS